MTRRIRPGEGWELALAELLTYTGWTYAHAAPAYVPGRRAPITPLRGPGARGFPDVVAWRPDGWRGPGRLLFAEAKAGSATPEPDQRRRLVELDDAGAEAYLFRERDADLIRELLLLELRPDPLEHPYPPLQPWRHPRSRSQAEAWGVTLDGRA